MLSRRHLIKVTPVAFLAGGCAQVSQSLDSALATGISYVQLAAAAANTLLTQLPGFGVAQAIVDTASGIVADIQSVANGIASVASTAATQPFVQKLGTYIGKLASTLENVPGLPNLALTVLQSLTAIIPTIVQVLGIVGVMAPRMKSPPAPSMTGEEARLRLATYVNTKR